MDKRFRVLSIIPPDKVPTTVSRVGVLFFLAFIVEWVTFYGLRDEALLTGHFILSLAFATVFSATIIYGGYRIRHSDLSPERYTRIANWFVGGLVVMFAMNALIIIVWFPSTPENIVGWLRGTMAMGGGGGLLFGIIEARAIQRELTAERATIRAEEAESQREWLDYLNSLLRHEVLNTANVITGYASMHLDDDLDDDLQRDLRRVHQQGQEMTEVIQDIQVLIQASQGNVERESVNLTEILTATIDDLQDGREAIEVTASIPDGVYVMADDLLPRVFANLLANAVQHNDSETPRVDVTVKVETDTVTVLIADNGPGIPDSVRDTLFERSDNYGSTHGLGLYLAQTLLERYDGTIQLAETGSDGSVFAVELPLANSVMNSESFSGNTSTHMA